MIYRSKRQEDSVRFGRYVVYGERHKSICALVPTDYQRMEENIVNVLEQQKKELFELLEIYDGYEALQDMSETLVGCTYGAGYDEGIIGKLAYVVDLIVSHSSPGLFNRDVDFADTELARILSDRELDNHRKAELLLGIGG